MSHRAAAEALPLQDAFAVLFFVSVGMLFDPAALLAQPVAVLLIVLLLVVGAKAAAAFLIVALLRRPVRVSLTVAAALSQVGEFSFILATMGLALGLIPDDAFQLVVAASIVSITRQPGAVPAGRSPPESWLRARPALLRLVQGDGAGASGRAASGARASARRRAMRGEDARARAARPALCSPRPCPP